jgi:hypothetical protein
MNTLFLYSVIAGLIGAAITAIALLVFTGNSVFKLSITSFFLTGLITFGLLYLVMPSFAHFTSGGTWLIVISTFGVSGLVCLLSSMRDTNMNHSIIGGGIFVMLLAVLILLGIVTVFVVPPAVMNNVIWDRIASLVEIRDATEEEIAMANTTDDELLKVSPSQARLEAKGEMPRDVGSYASIGPAFEQTINGKQYYITDLNVSDWRGFRQAGAYLPGYFKREARAIEAETVFVSGEKLRYVPEARFNKDLYRHVYLNYLLGCKGCLVENLEVLEIDNEGNPMYTGTVWKYVVGNKGIRATHVIVVDPTNGDITPYNIEDAPEWINRVYSMDVMNLLIGWWAKYSEWDARWISTNKGKMEIDTFEDVYGHNGNLQYMFTITAATANEEQEANQTLLYDIRVDPRTGEAVKYPASGKTVLAVKDMIDDQTFTEEFNTSTGAKPIECERQPLLGHMTYYCILQSKSEGEASEATVGYAFLQEQYTSLPNKVIVADTFDEAWNQLRLQVTMESEDTEIQAEEAELVSLQGELVRKSDSIIDDMIWFTVRDENDSIWYFRVSADNPMLGLSQAGDRLDLKAYDLENDDVNDVIIFKNLDLPSYNNSN